MAIVVSCVWPMMVAWLIARAVGQRTFFKAIERAPPPRAEIAPPVLVIVPARNEAANIEGCLLSLMNQTYPAQRLRVIMVDDHSEDRTVEIATSIARDKSQLSVVRSPLLPSNWIGKSHACWTGAGMAASDYEWLCFIDADVAAQPELLSSAVAFASTEGLSLLSLAPRQELKSFAERLVMPCGLYFLSFWQDLREAQSPVNHNATVTGQFMLIRRRDYQAVHGHAAVRNVICEDVALAGLLKQAGTSVALCDSGGLLSTRMYTGWSTLWPGLAKNLVYTLGGPLPTCGAAFFAVALSWAAPVLPFANLCGCMQGTSFACLGLGLALIGSASALGFHLAGARHFRIPLWYGVVFPLGYTAAAALAIDSVRRRIQGRVTWKGRIYS